MKFIGQGNKTYVLLSGIRCEESFSLSKNLMLMPADTSHLDFDTALSTCRDPDDIAIIVAFIPRVTAQFEVTSSNSKELAINAWNSSWDAMLLSAIFNVEVDFNLQSDTEASKINDKSYLCATNYHINGLTHDSYVLTKNDTDWLKINFENARKLIDDSSFQSAVNCLGSYRWHSMPRIQMAVLWAGIEGLFKASSEIRFRISLYIAQFLHPDNKDERHSTFNQVKRLYNSRSMAVHGSKIKGDIHLAVQESAEILRELIKKCIVEKSLPIEKNLLP